MSDDRRKRLRAALACGRLVVAPGVYDGVSARLADGFGFEALYMTGYGAVASQLGLPDAGLASYADMLSRVNPLMGWRKPFTPRLGERPAPARRARKPSRRRA